MESVYKQQVKNPNFQQEFGDYLKANGYTPGSQLTDVIYYFKKEHGIMISGDSVDFARFAQGDKMKGKPGCTRYAAFTGINQLDIFGWKLLLHVTGAVPLQQSPLKP
jgi:hypothetical protein